MAFTPTLHSLCMAPSEHPCLASLATMPCWFSLFLSMLLSLSPALALLLLTPNPVCCPSRFLHSLLSYNLPHSGASQLSHSPSASVFYCHSHLHQCSSLSSSFSFLGQGLNPDLRPLALRLRSTWAIGTFPHRCPSFHLECSVPTLPC